MDYGIWMNMEKVQQNELEEWRGCWNWKPKE